MIKELQKQLAILDKHLQEFRSDYYNEMNAPLTEQEIEKLELSLTIL